MTMRFGSGSLIASSVLMLVVVSMGAPLPAQEKNDGPTNDKAQKTYKEALKLLAEHRSEWALDNFKKADKQDGGKCLACQRQMVKYGTELGDWKAAELGAAEMTAEAQDDRSKAIAH